MKEILPLIRCIDFRIPVHWVKWSFFFFLSAAIFELCLRSYYGISITRIFNLDLLERRLELEEEWLFYAVSFCAIATIILLNRFASLTMSWVILLLLFWKVIHPVVFHPTRFPNINEKMVIVCAGFIWSSYLILKEIIKNSPRDNWPINLFITNLFIGILLLEILLELYQATTISFRVTPHENKQSTDINSLLGLTCYIVANILTIMELFRRRYFSLFIVFILQMLCFVPLAMPDYWTTTGIISALSSFCISLITGTFFLKRYIEYNTKEVQFNGS